MTTSIRRKSRELALQALFQSEMAGVSSFDALQMLADHFEVNRKAYAYAAQLVEGVTEYWQEINDLLEKHAVNWRMDRMSVVDRNIMRVAIFELCYAADVPANVVINEAIEVAKKFSTNDASSFINGILDGVRKSADSS